MELSVVCNIVGICLVIRGGTASYVSYKKTVSSSSVDQSSPDVTAVTDGDDMGDCFKSNQINPEWIIIDMDKTYMVSSVTVINIPAEPGSDDHLQMDDVEVQIGSYSSMSDGVVCGHPANQTQITTSQIIDFVCSPPISGRYLRFWHPVKSEHLNVCEIRIYDEEELGIGECSDPPLRINYYGFVGNTQGGVLCQEWSANSPHDLLINVPSSYHIHNLCRNPDDDPFGPWCYTVDPLVRFSYCDVPTVAESCPLQPFTGNLNPIGCWSVDLLCILSADNDHAFPTPIMELVVNENMTGCVVEITSSQTFLMTTNYEYYGTQLSELTIALMIIAANISSGNILSFGNSASNVVVNQDYYNDQMYSSGVSVYYANQLLTRAHVLQPDVWTLLALTFDGANRNIKLWRNGEVAGIGYVGVLLDHFNLDPNDVELRVGSSGGNFRAKLGLLHVYNRILDEAEMKAIREQILDLGATVRQGMFKKSMDSLRPLGKVTIRVIRSLAICSQGCIVDPLCKAFGFDKENNICKHMTDLEVIDGPSTSIYFTKIVEEVRVCDCENTIET